MSVVAGDTGLITRVPSSEAVRELRVQTSAYSAEYGRTSGAFISAVIDSGTADYHGALYEFVRNDKFNANNYFINARPLTAEQIAAGITKQPRLAERFNQFGARIGGPLPFFNFGEGGPAFTSGKNGRFFFIHYEGLRQSMPTNF